MAKNPSLYVVFVFLPVAWAQQQGAAVAQPAPVTKAASLRIDSVRRVDAGNMYHHVFARVPLMGSGSTKDPKRPMFAALPGEESKDHTGILSYQMQISDDGKWALVEFVGATPKDLEIITKSADPNVKAFERGHSTLAEVQAEFAKYKASFSVSTFASRAQ